MKYLFLVLLSSLSFAAELPITPFPVFLRAGFSSVLEFDEAPAKIILGDSQSFQVEKLDKSLVIKTLVPYATSNMFVYFREQDTKLFVLTASEDAKPTYFRKFEKLILPKIVNIVEASKSIIPLKQGISLVSAQFDAKKDYLTVEVLISANSKEILKPHWDWVRLSFNKSNIIPQKIWSERQEIQKDSRVRARFIFIKPNIPKNLLGASLIVPIYGDANSLIVNLRGKR